MLAGDAGAGPVQVTPGLGRRAQNDRQTVTIAAARRATSRRTPLAFTAARDHRRRRGSRSPPPARALLRVGTVSLMPADNVEGLRADTLRAAARARLARLPLAGRQLRQRLRLARRHRRPRQAPAAQEPGLAGRRAQRRRHRRVHGASAGCSNTEPYIAVNSGLGDVHVGGRRGRVRQRRGDDAAWASCGRRTATREPYGVQVLVDRQRDVRRLAARPHAARRSTSGEAQRVRRGDAREGPVDHAGRRRRRRARGPRGC